MPTGIHPRLLSLLLLGACGPQPAVIDLSPALEQIRFAPLEPGAGLGNLRLGVTTVGDCLLRYARFEAALQRQPQPTLELTLASGRLRLLFALEDIEEQAARAEPTSAEAFARSPHCADTVLSTIELSSAPDRDRYHFGRYAGQLELTSSADDVVLLLGRPTTARPTRDEFVLGYPGIGFWCRREGADQPAHVERIVLWQPLPAAPR